MADANVNKSLSSTTTSSSGASTAQSTDGTSSNTSGAVAASKAAGEVSSPKFYVDGQSVSKEEYLRQAEKAGWNSQHLEERKFYPSISTTKSAK